MNERRNVRVIRASVQFRDLLKGKSNGNAYYFVVRIAASTHIFCFKPYRRMPLGSSVFPALGSDTLGRDTERWG